MLQQYGSISRLGVTSSSNCCKLKVGPAKAVQLQAAIELARRALGEQLKAGVNLNSPKAVHEFLRLTLRRQDKEVFLASSRCSNRVLATEQLSEGTLTQTSVFPREIVKRAYTVRPHYLRTTIPPV